MPDRAAPGSRRLGVLSGLGVILGLGLAAITLVGLLGRWNPWADIVNQFAPIWLCLSAAGLIGVVLIKAWRRSAWPGVLICGALVVQAALVGPELFAGARVRFSSPAEAKDRLFSVLTFNVWNDSKDRAAVIARIVASGADVVTLQEALGVEQLSSAALAAAYPYQATCDDSWGCEILILSKRPILDRHYAAPPPTGTGGPLWAVWVTTTTREGRRVRVLSTHFVWPLYPAVRQAQVDELAEIVGGLRGTPLIATGDCNAGGASFTLRDQDSKLAPLTRRTRATFSWPAVVDGANWMAAFPFLAIDQVYASREWRTVAVRRLPRSGSDHYPILVTLAPATDTD